MFHRIERDSTKPLTSYNGEKVYYVDGIPMIIKSVHSNIAHGYVIKDDMNLEECYVAKGHGYFAHGNSIKGAIDALESKILSNLDIDTKIKEFKETFKKGVKYSGHEYYNWHNILTGSCEFGRNNFVKNHNINLDDELTPNEFLKLVEGEYGWSILEQLVKHYK